MVGSTISWEGAEGGRARGREQKEEEVLCNTLKCTRPTKSANSADGIAMSELCKRSAMLHTLHTDQILTQDLKIKCLAKC